MQHLLTHSDNHIPWNKGKITSQKQPQTGISNAMAARRENHARVRTWAESTGELSLLV